MLETKSNQFLTFNLGTEKFALEIMQAREVLDNIEITKVPRTPEFMRGVINLRGNVVPVLDLKMNLGMEASVIDSDTCIVIVEIEHEGEPLVIGTLADSVHEVVEIAHEDIEPAPKLGTKLNTEFVKAMGKRGDDFMVILDMDRVLSGSVLFSLNKEVNAAFGGPEQIES